MTASHEDQRLFVYGTLLFAPVVERVIGRFFPTLPARLWGYDRWQLRGAVYPALAPHVGAGSAVVLGQVWSQLNAETLRRLDEYEDDFYERRSVTVVLDGGEEQTAQCYVLAQAHSHRAAPELWDPARFERDHLQAFLAGLSLQGPTYSLSSRSERR